MPLLTATQKKFKKIALNIFIEESLFVEVKTYCDWTNVDKPIEFVLQAIYNVLKNDKRVG